MAQTTAHRLLYAAAALSLVAALIHLWVMPEHMEEWWGYGTFFLVLAVVQALYAVALVRRPRRWLLVAGIVGNLAVIGLWVVTRTLGIPFFGPHAGETEAVGGIDVASKLAEAALVALLGVLLWRAQATWHGHRRLPPRNGAVGCL